MRSRLYKGRVHHARLRPKRHQLTYSVYSLLLDLDELTDDRPYRLLRINRKGLFSFWEKDHGLGNSTGLKDWALSHLAQAGYETEGVRVNLLCYPRVAGIVFNPLSIYYCYRADGTLFATLHEVHNTFGGKHTYVLPASVGSTGDVVQSTSKEMPVSPFTPQDARYDFRLSVPGDTVRVRIQLSDAQDALLTASFVGDARPLSDRELLTSFLQIPFVTLKVIAGIHFEALRIWLRGMRFLPRPPSRGRVSASYPPVDPDPNLP